MIQITTSLQLRCIALVRSCFYSQLQESPDKQWMESKLHAEMEDWKKEQLQTHKVATCLFLLSDATEQI